MSRRVYAVLNPPMQIYEARFLWLICNSDRDKVLSENADHRTGSSTLGFET